MREPGRRRGRTHNAEGAREAILDAAEEVFAEHGFDGARIDAIASAAGYNKSLIFQYFGDKLSLYGEVIRRGDQRMSGMQAQWLAALLQDDATTEAHNFEALLKSAVSAYFDYLVDDPRFMRILLWEMAEGWQTFAKIVSEGEREEIDEFWPLLRKAQQAGLLRSDFEVRVQVLTAVYFCHYYLGSVPLYQMLVPDEDFSSAAALARAREYVMEFVVHGMMADPVERKP